MAHYHPLTSSDILGRSIIINNLNQTKTMAKKVVKKTAKKAVKKAAAKKTAPKKKTVKKATVSKDKNKPVKILPAVEKTVAAETKAATPTIGGQSKEPRNY